jgi:hypothetical protein
LSGFSLSPPKPHVFLSLALQSSVAAVFGSIISKAFGFLNRRKVHLMLSLLFFFFIILLLPIRVLLTLLGLDYLLPVVMGFYACILTTVSLFLDNKSLLSFYQLFHVFILALSFSCLAFHLKQYDLIPLIIYSFMPLCAMMATTEYIVSLPSRLFLLADASGSGTRSGGDSGSNQGGNSQPFTKVTHVPAPFFLLVPRGTYL